MSGLGRGLTLAMAVAAGLGVANIYYNQPMLGVIQRDFPGDAATSLVPTATQLGYALGLLLLVPVGDLMDRRKLIVFQFLVLAVSLAGAALAPSAALLVVASLLVGVASTVAQHIIPFAAALAAPERRGQTVGTAMGGLLCGILLSRTLAGLVATHWGWRQMFELALPLALAGAGLMAARLPRDAVRPHLSYGAALGSLGGLWRGEKSLRRATAVQAALFGAFSAFWTILALHLEQPSIHLGADVAGLFGIVGAVGVLAAPVAGRLADRHGPGRVILVGAASVLVSWLAIGLWDGLAGLVVGIIVLDFGVQSAMVSNQHIVYALRPEARGRLNTLYMTGMFLGGSTGSAGAMLAWRLGGWAAVCAWGAGLSLMALALSFSSARPACRTDPPARRGE